MSCTVNWRDCRTCQFDNRSCLPSFSRSLECRTQSTSLGSSQSQDLIFQTLNRSSCSEVELHIGLGAMTQVIGWNIPQYLFGCLEHDTCSSAKKSFTKDKMGSLLASQQCSFSKDCDGLPKGFANF